MRKNYKNSKLSKKLLAYYKELIVFSIKLPVYYEQITSDWSNLINQFLGSLRYKEYVQFIYLSALGQYLFAKLEKKIYTNSKISIKISAYYKELLAFSTKLSAYYEKITSDWSNLINQVLGSSRCREYVQFIYLGVLGQYLFVKLEKKKLYEQQAF